MHTQMCESVYTYLRHIKNSCIAENNKTTILNIIEASLLPGLHAAGKLSRRVCLFKRPPPIDGGLEDGVRTGRLGLAYR